MCQHLVAIEVTSSTDPTETINFRKLLLRKCQRQFELDSAELTEIENKKKAMEENTDVCIFSFVYGHLLFTLIRFFVKFRNRRN